MSPCPRSNEGHAAPLNSLIKTDQSNDSQLPQDRCMSEPVTSAALGCHLKRKNQLGLFKLQAAPLPGRPTVHPTRQGAPVRVPARAAPHLLCPQREAQWRPPGLCPIWEVKNGWGVPSGTQNMQLCFWNLYRKQNLPHRTPAHPPSGSCQSQSPTFPPVFTSTSRGLSKAPLV